MPWPMSQDYNEAIQSPATSFSDPELKAGQVVCNAMGLPVPCSGNFADVYALQSPRQKWAVKCFTREIPGIRERYVEVSKYLARQNLPFMVEFKFLDQGIRIRGQWYPVLKMHWVEGMTLNHYVRLQLGNPTGLQTLAQTWAKVATRLREAHLAHCDLQHGNVLLVPNQKGTLGVRLVDYDGMFVPALEFLKSIELGHPNYQHPQRFRDRIYSVEVDRFSHLVIYTALRALMTGGKSLWDRFDNGDNLLFKQADLANPSQSPLFRDLQRMNDPEVRRMTDALADAVRRPLNQSPLLDQLVDGGGRKPTTVKVPGPTIVQLDPRSRVDLRIRRRKPVAWKRWLAVGGVAALLMAAGAGVAWLVTQSGEKQTAVASAETEMTSPVTTESQPPPDTKPITPPDSDPKPITPPETKPITPPDPKPIMPPEPKPKAPPDPKPKAPPDPKPITPLGTKPKPITLPDTRPIITPGKSRATFQGHGGWVNSVAFNPDGKTLVSGSYDKTIKLWNVASGKNIATLQGQIGAVNSVAFSADGKTLVPGGNDKAIELWDVASSKNSATLQGHLGPVESVAFSPNTLASGSYDKTIKLWEVASGKNTATLEGHMGAVNSVAFSPDGKTLASGSVDTTIKLWDVVSGTNTATLQGQIGAVNSVAFSPDGKTLASGSVDTTIKLWDVGSGTNTATLQGHGRAVKSVAFSPDGKTLASGSEDTTIKLWDVVSGTNTATLQEHGRVVKSVAFSPDGKTLASGSEDKTIKLWQMGMGALQAAMATLKTQPNDPAANLFVGKHHFINQANPDLGLPHIAKGSDAKLKGLAILDLAGAKEPQKQMALGDDWFDLAGTVIGPARTQYLRRAVHWYQQALPGLTGSDLIKVQSRLK